MKKYGNLIFAIILFVAGLGCFIYNNKADITALVPALILFAVGFFLLIKGGDWFVDGASAIAEKFKVPEILIGATVVSIGTTLPEVMVSAQAAAKGNGAISYGNAIGSIICNVSLIAAITLAVKPAKADRKSLIVPVLFFFTAAGLYTFTAYVTGNFTRTTGIVLLCMFVVYMVITVLTALKSKGKPDEAGAEEKEEKDMPIFVAIILLILGAAIIAFGATLLVDNGTIIAKKVGVPDSVIALTVVALGTSLPELVTAITSLIKGHGSLSLGNIIGANLFNLVLVSGMAITIKPFEVPTEKMFLNTGLNSSLVVEIPLMLFVMLFLTVPALVKGKLYRWQGITLLLLYAGFCVYQFAF
ncbi:cation:H+ antiporter [Lachnospiraceae bacterium G41]|nr:cation:H+ antiporter [Lachnospiraceae bacterium G41]